MMLAQAFVGPGGELIVSHREIDSDSAEPTLHEVCHLIIGDDYAESDVIDMEISLLTQLTNEQSAWVEKSLRDGIPDWEFSSPKIKKFIKGQKND